jgi:UDP-N-acetylglucosamine 2-epimerase (non-hydrolysing)
MKVLSIFGTRPEAIKMAPLVKALSNSAQIESVVCVTGQHQQMLQQVMELFDIRADYDLALMSPNQTLNGLAGKVMLALEPVLEAVKPDRVLVHGDTTSAMAASMSAFHRGIPVGHVEAGLRTGNLRQPWPEEMNRRSIDLLSDMMYAPTASSRDNLLQENLSGQILVTGNTVIDSLRMTVERIDADVSLQRELDSGLPAFDPEKKILLVTGHRRENFGEGFEQICRALRSLADRSDIEIVYPVHLNPNVQQPVRQHLQDLPNVHLIAPLDYLRFVRLMQRSYVILTDSGGVQEEAPFLGKPVLVMRDVTERPEAVAAGTVTLVGTSPARIVSAVHGLYNDHQRWASFAHNTNPYGDGFASDRIVASLTGQVVNEFKYDAQAFFRRVANV